MNYLFYNELASAGKIVDSINNIKEELAKSLNGEIHVVSSKNLDLSEYLTKLKENDKAIIIGGDGTLNYQINHLPIDNELPCALYLYPFGSGNDFLNDVKEYQDKNTKLILLNNFLKSLPIVEVNGMSFRFINGIGYGIDGECCKKAEQLKKEGVKDINYSKITIGLLFKGYKPPHSTLKIDGKEIGEFDRTYISATMKGKYYGGGMMVAPNQDRSSKYLSNICVHSKSKFKILMTFPKIFKGTHINNKNIVSSNIGKVIEVSFDSPTALQIDGEVVENVLSYKAYIK